MMRVLIVISLIALCQGYKTYQDNIPNGGRVPHPCKPNFIWQGVGHENMLGGGDRNPFGLAFKDAGYTWTTALCNADSDQDGKSNGEELGDPNCVWTPGNAASTVLGLSHPGVCEPVDSADCQAKNSWTIDCSEGADFTCDGIADPDGLNYTAQFTRTAVPAVETTYMCQSFTFPDDKEYHLIASRPEIDNAYVMHHTIVYGCPDGVDGFETPKPCGMGSSICTIPVAGWTVGQAGTCGYKKTGLLVGKGHFRTILIEHHWNNPEEKTDYYDSSGMTFFMTPNLRQYNTGFMATGQTELELAPGQPSITKSGICASDCLKRKMKDSVFITSVNLHMHYLGVSGIIEQWRDGSKVMTWANDETYSYDLPITHEFDPPVELRPGDHLITNCTFKTTSQSEVTYFGEATSDEMCFGFMTYYPAEVEVGTCVSHGEYGACEIEDYYKGLEDPDNGVAHDTLSTALIAAVSVLILLI